MALTGDGDGPPLAPPTTAATTLDDTLAPFELDAAVAAERAALLGLSRSGHVSCGGATRLLPAGDGWLALSLARPDDVASLPALFETDAVAAPDAPTAWPLLPAVIGSRPADEVVDRARLLGVPCARMGEPVGPFAVEGSPRASGPRPAPVPAPLVVDLSALWAGPLAGSLLARRGATVVKVEDRRRPDGARRGHPGFFDLLNGGKHSVALDLGQAADRAALRALVERADIVITSARARAIHHLDLDPEAFLAAGDDRVWVAVTAHGWASDRVGFGDDTAVAAGLVAVHPDDGEPRFAADALADPLCGARAGRAALDAWTTGGRWFVDASLAGAAASVSAPGRARTADGAPGRWTLDGTPVASPVARTAPTPGRPLGADTATWITGSVP